MIEGHIHRIRLEEARGRLSVVGRCECGFEKTYDAYWDETPGGWNGTKKREPMRSYGTDPLSKLRVKW